MFFISVIAIVAGISMPASFSVTQCTLTYLSTLASFYFFSISIASNFLPLFYSAINFFVALLVWLPTIFSVTAIFSAVISFS